MLFVSWAANVLLTNAFRSQAADQMMGLYRLMIEKDATTVEINPMVEVEENGQKRGKLQSRNHL